jgi:hypothetical protein
MSDAEFEQELQEKATDISKIEMGHTAHLYFLLGARWAKSKFKEKLDLAVDALKKVESGAECSACSCACHSLAGVAIEKIMGGE